MLTEKVKYPFWQVIILLLTKAKKGFSHGSIFSAQFFLWITLYHRFILESQLRIGNFIEVH